MLELNKRRDNWKPNGQGEKASPAAQCSHYRHAHKTTLYSPFFYYRLFTCIIAHIPVLSLIQQLDGVFTELGRSREGVGVKRDRKN